METHHRCPQMLLHDLPGEASRPHPRPDSYADALRWEYSPWPQSQVPRYHARQKPQLWTPRRQHTTQSLRILDILKCLPYKNWSANIDQQLTVYKTLIRTQHQTQLPQQEIPHQCYQHQQLIDQYPYSQPQLNTGSIDSHSTRHHGLCRVRSLGSPTERSSCQGLGCWLGVTWLWYSSKAFPNGFWTFYLYYLNWIIWFF